LDKNYKLREIEEEYKNLLIKAEKNYQVKGFINVENFAN
jgi:hypothetical protein